ncbi:MAG TPA: LamG domain-containing protein, partial [Bryobacterales bacterium]|nr:LamG domain-containing protein [Bryobacterales bacterium]
SDSISIPWSPRLTPSRFTLRTWLKLENYPAGFGVVFANYGGNYQGWYVAVQSDGRVLFSLNRLPASYRRVLSSSALDLNRWYRLTVTYDGRTQSAAVYLDGVLEGEAIVAGLTPQDSGIASIAKASWHNGYRLAFSIDETELIPGVWPPAVQ